MLSEWRVGLLPHRSVVSYSITQYGLARFVTGHHVTVHLCVLFKLSIPLLKLAHLLDMGYLAITSSQFHQLLYKRILRKRWRATNVGLFSAQRCLLVTPLEIQKFHNFHNHISVLLHLFPRYIYFHTPNFCCLQLDIKAYIKPMFSMMPSCSPSPKVRLRPDAKGKR